MTLAAGCPRCASPVTGEGEDWSCQDHGGIVPLWRPAKAGYEDFVAYLERSAPMPALVPWPLGAGWTVTDFGCVVRRPEAARAGFVSCAGPSAPDGVVDLTVVSEEPGVGLGARVAGATRTDPGADIGEGPPHVKVRVDDHPVSLWSVSTSDSDTSFDRSVFAGEAQGRWLWLVLRPAAAALMLNDELGLFDLAELGPELVDLPFGGAPPLW